MKEEERVQDMNLQELTALRSKIDEEVRRRRAQEKLDAQRQIVDLARKYGIDLASLAGKEKVYKNPENPWETWTGKGRKPNWLVRALRSGKSLDDLTK